MTATPVAGPQVPRGCGQTLFVSPGVALLLILRLAQLGHGMVGAEEDVVPALRPSDVLPSTHAFCAVTLHWV